MMSGKYARIIRIRFSRGMVVCYCLGVVCACIRVRVCLYFHFYQGASALSLGNPEQSSGSLTFDCFMRTYSILSQQPSNSSLSPACGGGRDTADAVCTVPSMRSSCCSARSWSSITNLRVFACHGPQQTFNARQRHSAASRAAARPIGGSRVFACKRRPGPLHTAGPNGPSGGWDVCFLGVAPLFPRGYLRIQEIIADPARRRTATNAAAGCWARRTDLGDLGLAGLPVGNAVAELAVGVVLHLRWPGQ